MTEPDLTAGWRPIGGMLAEQRPVDPQPEPAADKKIQRYQAKAAEKRTDRHDAIQTWTEKRQAIRDERNAARAERREQRAERQIDRTNRASRIKQAAARLAEQLLVTGPILAPMAVAWTGQSEFAMRVLGWAFTASVLYAAAYELTTVYCAWLYHQARSDGDSGWEYRFGTWVFAVGAAVQQWWHYSDHWHPTPRSVTYSIMSIVGVLLWEGRARLIHRRKLRAEDKLPQARPRIGLARWIRYPVRSWTAWSLITLEGHQTLDAAWTAADAFLRSREALRADRAKAHRTARLDRINERRTSRTAPALQNPGPTTDRTALPAASSGPDRQPAGPDRTAKTDRAERTAGPGLAAGPDREQHDGARTTDRSTPDQRPPTRADSGPQTTDQPVHEAPAEGSDRPDRSAVDLVLNEVEQQAIELLRSTGRSISKRNIADVVRNELDRSIGSDRAAIIARHFRTLRSAA